MNGRPQGKRRKSFLLPPAGGVLPAELIYSFAVGFSPAAQRFSRVIFFIFKQA